MQVIGLAMVAALWGTAAAAKECRQAVLDNGKSGESVDENTKAGGHVHIHIQGNTPKLPKDQFEPKSQFVNATDAFTAFKTWSKLAVDKKKMTPEKCGANTSKSFTDCVDAKLVGSPQGIICWEIDSKGQCDPNKIEQIGTVKKVGFTYHSSKNTGSVWILHTAFPSDNEWCLPPAKKDEEKSSGKGKKGKR